MLGGPTFLKVGESHTFVTLALSSAAEAELPPPSLPPYAPHRHKPQTLSGEPGHTRRRREEEGGQKIESSSSVF